MLNQATRAFPVVSLVFVTLACGGSNGSPQAADTGPSADAATEDVVTVPDTSVPVSDVSPDAPDGGRDIGDVESDPRVDDVEDDVEPDGDVDTSMPPPMGEPSQWRSALYPLDWSPSSRGPQGRYLHDFSYAGYHGGEEAIPDEPPGVRVTVTEAPWSADPTGERDATAALQAAIDSVGQQGGGVVYLPAGTYRVAPPEGSNTALRIRHGGVVLRGAGRALTYVFNDAVSMRNRAVITVAPEGRYNWYTAPGPSVPMVEDADARTTEVLVADTAPFEVGDWVVIRATASDAWVAEHDMTDLWDEDLVRGPTFLRQVVEVSEDDRALRFDIPLRYRVRTRDDARVYFAGPHLSEVGLEDFSIAMRQHPGRTGWGDIDYNVEGTSAHDVHGADAIRFQNVIDGWVQRVASYHPAVNEGDYHLLSDGLLLFHSRNITVRQTFLHKPQYEGGGGNGYSFILRGSDNLIWDCGAISARHAYSFKKMAATGNVILGSSSSGPRYSTDFHMHLSLANLLDGMVLDGDFVDATYRPYGSNHGFTTTQTTIWNTRGLRNHPRSDVIVDSRQFDWGLVIGTQGAAVDVKTTPLVDTRDTAPVDFVEGVGAGATLGPASVYEDQLHRRTQGSPAPTLRAQTARVATADALVRDGEDAGTNFGDRMSLHIKDSGAGYVRRSYLRFLLTDLPPDLVRARLVVHGRVTDQGGDHTSLTAFAVDDDGWDELSITWDEQPGFGAALDTVRIASSERPVALDVTAFVRAELSGDGVASFALAQQLEGRGLFVSLPSRESGDTRAPRLEVLLPPGDVLPLTVLDADMSDEGTRADWTVDGDLGTRWSSQGHGRSITWDLGEIRAVAGVSLAFYQGEGRIAYFGMSTSMDGERWRPLPVGQSAGDSSEHQLFRTPATMRYLRFVGYGNTANEWNSITEVRVYAAPG